jgi:hypothetical protein
MMLGAPWRARGQATAAAGHVAVGEPTPAVHDRRPVGEDSGRAVEEGRGRQLSKTELSYLTGVSQAAAAHLPGG